MAKDCSITLQTLNFNLYAYVLIINTNKSVRKKALGQEDRTIACTGHSLSETPVTMYTYHTQNSLQSTVLT